MLSLLYAGVFSTLYRCFLYSMQLFSLLYTGTFSTLYRCLLYIGAFSTLYSRKRPKFWFGSIRFGVRLILAGSVRFGKNFAKLFVIQFHAHLQYTGIKRTDYAILCNKSFSQSQQKTTIHISTTPFYVVKLSACCGEGFYIHALIL